MFYAHWSLVHAMILGPRPAAGVEAANAMLTTFGRHPWPMMALAIASGADGQGDIALAVYEELAARARTGYVQPTVLAMAALGAKRLDDCFRHFRTAVELRDPMFALLAGHWPPLATIRDEPEFVRTLAAIGWDRPFEGAEVRG